MPFVAIISKVDMTRVGLSYFERGLMDFRLIFGLVGRNPT